MRYLKFPPAAELKHFVECYFIWEGQTTSRLEVQSPPSGFPAMVFNYGDPTVARQNSTREIAVPPAFACGQFTSNYQLILEGKIGMAGTVFKPSAFHNFFGCKMSCLVNNRMPLNLVLGPTADELWNQMKMETTDECRVAMLQDLLMGRLAEAKRRLSVVDEAVDYIEHQNGCVSVDEVAIHLKVSRRYLEKQFLEKVGVSPKFYARVKRFSVLSNRIAHNEKIDWQDIVFENGFHDQSHLVKDFIEFNRMSPSDYHRQHKELTRFVRK
jgi:AraC-like DNA-binding protein